MSSDFEFTKENIDLYLKKLAGEFRKHNGRKTPAEIIIVGGASAMLNYSFRTSTLDVDAYYAASSALKEAVRAVAEKEGLEPDWLNNDFQFLSQCNTAQLRLHSVFYKRYANGLLEVRTVAAEYLIALKMRSGRRFRNDLSDIVGILEEERKNGHQITMDVIDCAVIDLFGDKQHIAIDIYEEVSRFTKDVIQEDTYIVMKQKETENFQYVTKYAKNLPDTKGKLNGNAILEELRKRQ